MTATAVLAIVVAVGEAHNPATTTLLATAAQSVGPATSIRLIEVQEPTDANALRVESELRAEVVVTISWKERAHLHALIRLHVARANRWTTRTIDFSSGDTLAERGRTLGLAVASMWPEALPVRETAAMAEQPRSEAPPPTPAPAPDAANGSSPNQNPRSDVAQPSQPDRRPPPPAAPPARATPPEPKVDAEADAKADATPDPLRHVAIGIAAVGSMGAGGPASGLGGGAGGVLFLTTNLALRVGAYLRSGPVPALPGSDLVGALAVGFEWWAPSAWMGRTFGAGIRADGIALRHQVRGAGMNGQVETQDRFLPAVDIIVQSTARVGARLELFLGLGAEMAMGTTDIRKGPDRLIVATIPALRAVAEAGLRVGF